MKDSSKNHRIDDDGYNVGRDYFVERAVAGSHWDGKWWKAEVEWREGLMPRGRRGMSDYLCSYLHFVDASQASITEYQWTAGLLSSQSTASNRRMFHSLILRTYHRHDL